MMLERGVFTLSFDVELAWGVFYRHPSGRVDEARLREALRAVPLLLELLARHDAPASFAVVGHLLEGCCPGHGADPRPRYAFGPSDWYAVHPGGGQEEAPLWYARDLVASIRASHRRHEIAAHGYTHAPLGEPGASAELARCEIAAFRYRVLHVAARITRGARRLRLRIDATWRWASAIATAWQRIRTAFP